MNNRGHKVALSGSYSGNIESLLENLHSTGVFNFSSIGREITLQVKSENLTEVMETLKKKGVSNLTVLEWRKNGVTLAGPGAGSDEDNMVKVSLIPATLDEGIKSLAVLEEFEVDEKTLKEIDKRIGDILADAGVTDVLYTLHFKKSNRKDYIKAAEVATLNALFESGGVITIE